MTSKSKQVGASGEFAVIQALFHDQFDVFRDVSDSCIIDLIARKNNELITIQVKTISSSKNEYVDVFFMKRQRKNGKHLSFRLDGSEYDVLAYYIVDRDIVLYFRPSQFNQTKVRIFFNEKQPSFKQFLSLDQSTTQNGRPLQD